MEIGKEYYILGTKAKPGPLEIDIKPINITIQIYVKLGLLFKYL